MLILKTRARTYASRRVGDVLSTVRRYIKKPQFMPLLPITWAIDNPSHSTSSPKGVSLDVFTGMAQVSDLLIQRYIKCILLNMLSKIINKTKVD